MMNSIAIVTGSGSGMGYELTKIIDENYKHIQEIWAIDLDNNALTALSESKKNIRSFELDLTKEGLIEEIKTLLETEKPSVEILVNSAGYGMFGGIAGIPYEDEMGMIKLNCEALTAVTYIVLPFMPDGSRIINFASTAGFVPQANFGVYGATKAYVLSYTQALREELKNRKIEVTAVCPGPVDTHFFDVAETYTTSKVTNLIPKSDPVKVALQAFEDNKKGKSISSYGIVAKGIKVSPQIMPVGWIANAENHVENFLKDEKRQAKVRQVKKNVKSTSKVLAITSVLFTVGVVTGAVTKHSKR